MNSQLYIPALRGNLGDWVYYSALLKAKDVSERIKSSHTIRESKALEDFLQRTLKPRVKKITQYLIKRDSRFFNSIIVGVFDGIPDWREFDLTNIHKNLGINIEESQELQENLGLLIFTGSEKMFAIDGQHRVEGIKDAYKRAAQRIGDDQFPVIFVAHIDDQEGKVRTRRLFCDINKNAVPVSQGDKVVIDEDDLSAIVTRKIYATYPHFKNGDEIAVTERKENLIQDGQERFTSILALYTVTKKIKILFRKKRGTLENDKENVNEFFNIVKAFFDFIIEHEPSLNNYFIKKKTTIASERKNNKNLLFRPVGLEVLARIYAYFFRHNLESVLVSGLGKLKFQNPNGTFDGILWSQGKISAGAKEKSAAVELCLYLLGALPKRNESELRDKIAEIKKDPNYKLPSKFPS